jgi:anti-sigma regulatory factor (Ser/Thr protein kinase)
MPEEPDHIVELTIPMLPDMEIAVTKTAEAVAQWMRLSPDKTAEVSLALIEACLNSFEHSRSPDRKIYISFRAHADELKIILKDRGVGFNPRQVETPEIDKKLFPGSRKRGWGLKLMESLMDSVNIESSPEGTTITMTKKK